MGSIGTLGNVDQVRLEIDVGPTKAPELAGTQATKDGNERQRPPDFALVGRGVRDDGLQFLFRRNDRTWIMTVWQIQIEADRRGRHSSDPAGGRP